jgi:diguanylate cyclase (GGDEF)-like protein
VPADVLQPLLALARFLVQRHPLDELLVEVVESAARIVGCARASVRVFDPERTQLVALVRAGEPVHAAPGPFALGEGLMGWVATHEAPLRLDDASADPRFAPRPDQRVPIGSFLGVPLVAGEGCVGVLSFVDEARGAFDARHEELALLVAAVCAPHIEVARLAALTQLDALTGVLNRRGLDAELAQAASAGGAVIVVDVDHFKQVNDRFGHAIGDRVLRQVAEVLGAVTRRGDRVARLGGEEFVVLLRDTSIEAAVRVAERARERLAAMAVDTPAGPVAITASFGVAEALAAGWPSTALARADAAMYEAKRAGRNRVHVAG